MSISRSRPITRSPKSVTFFDGSNERGCVNVEAPPQHHERLEDAEEAERRDQPREARRVAEQRHHDVGEQPEPDADEESERDGQRRRHAAVAQVVTDVGGDAAERTGAEVQDARRAVHEHDPEGDERGERSRRGPEQHEAQRRLAPQRRCEHHGFAASAIARAIERRHSSICGSSSPSNTCVMLAVWLPVASSAPSRDQAVNEPCP